MENEADFRGSTLLADDIADFQYDSKITVAKYKINRLTTIQYFQIITFILFLFFYCYYWSHAFGEGGNSDGCATDELQKSIFIRIKIV